MTMPLPLFASEGGFGLNLNLFETNLINLVIVIGVLYWFLKGFLGGILERRRQAILKDLEDSEGRLRQATTDLARAQEDLAAAQQKAEKIRSDGKARAEAIRKDGEMRTINAMAAVKQDALADLNAEGARLTEQLRREAAECHRCNPLHPDQKPKKSYVETVLEGEPGPFIAASDYVRALSEQISPYVPGGLYCLGTDGMGRSETRQALRRHFEVDAQCITLAALYQLQQHGELDASKVANAIQELGIDPEKPNPYFA